MVRKKSTAAGTGIVFRTKKTVKPRLVEKKARSNLAVPLDKNAKRKKTRFKMITYARRRIAREQRSVLSKAGLRRMVVRGCDNAMQELGIDKGLRISANAMSVFSSAMDELAVKPLVESYKLALATKSKSNRWFHFVAAIRTAAEFQPKLQGAVARFDKIMEQIKSEGGPCPVARPVAFAERKGYVPKSKSHVKTNSNA